MAIQLNDYLTLGASLGIPALFCFAMYIRLTMKAAGGESEAELKMPIWNSAGRALDWLKLVCRAGAVVLLIGFWFDSGLFKLATASTFWILLGLGGRGNHEMCEAHENG